MLVGLIRSPAQLQKVANISLSTHEHFPTAALGEGKAVAVVHAGFLSCELP